MRKILSALLSVTLLTTPVLVLPLLTGCASLGDGLSGSNAQRINTSVKLAAYLGTQAYLTKNPQTRPAFVLASGELRALAVADNIDAVSLLAIVNRLPVKQLESPQSKVIVTAATIILSDFAGELQLDQLKQLQPVALAMADGIDLGLGTGTTP